jgi:hypothetical protein
VPALLPTWPKPLRVLRNATSPLGGRVSEKLASRVGHLSSVLFRQSRHRVLITHNRRCSRGKFNPAMSARLQDARADRGRSSREISVLSEVPVATPRRPSLTSSLHASSAIPTKKLSLARPEAKHSEVSESSLEQYLRNLDHSSCPST